MSSPCLLYTSEIPVETDDIDHFGNRRLRSVGELIQNQVRTGPVSYTHLDVYKRQGQGVAPGGG